MKLKIAICDDEAFYLKKSAEVVRDNLEKAGIEDYVIDKYQSGEALLAMEEKLKEYQVLFLDIEMPNENGLQIAEKVQIMNPDVILVFVTSYINFAPASMRLSALRYVMKMELELYLPEAVRAVIQSLQLKNASLTYDFVEGTQKIWINNIYYIESKNHILEFNMANGEKHVLYEKLDCVEKEVSPYHFIRIHKSFLVNCRYIRSIENYRLTLCNGEILSVPRKRYQEVKELYYDWKGSLQ